MSKHPVYGLLYIILLPFALLMGFSVLISLVAALQTPAALIPMFLIACMVIYTITSFIFYSKAVGQGKQCKPSLRDWIRVNAFVSIVVGALLLMESLVVIIEPTLIAKGIEQLKDMQQLPMPESQLSQYILYVFYAFLVYSAALVAHIIYTFVLLSKYRAYFGTDTTNIDSFGQGV